MTIKQYREDAEKKYRSLQFRDDFLFCKILTENEDITKELLELILGIKIGKVRVAKQEPIEITADGRGIRLDVYAEDDENTVFDVEMQTTQQKYLPKRARYYQGMIDLNLISRGDDFRKLKKAFVIFICMKDPFPGYDRYVYTFENICREEPELVLGDETCKVFLNASGSKGTVSDGMKDFLKLLREGHGDSGLSKKIEEQVERAKAHDEWRLEFMTLYMRDRQNREEGFEEGIAKGHAEGLEEGRKATIINAIKKGRSVEDIADFMDCSIEEVQDIKAQFLSVSSN